MRKQNFRSIVIQVLAASLLLCLALHGQDSDKPLTNADIIKMAKAGVRESVILASIQGTPTKFDVRPPAVSLLKRAGVTQRVIEAMATAGSGVTPQAAPTPVAPVQTAASRRRSPTVTMLDEGRTLALPKERAQLLQTKTKPASLTKLASDSMLGQAVQGGINIGTQEAMNRIQSPAANSSVSQASTIFGGALARRKAPATYVWAVANPASANVLQGEQPSFTVDFSRVLNVKLDDFAPVLIKLTPAPTGQYTCRLVGATQGKEDALASFSEDWQVYSGFMEDRAPFKSQKIAPGKFKVSASAPLGAGEYAIVLRPVSKTKKFSAGDIERNQGDGLLFNSVWSFEVPGDDN